MTKTLAQVQAMDYYPWRIEDTSIINVAWYFNHNRQEAGSTKNQPFLFVSNTHLFAKMVNITNEENEMSIPVRFYSVTPEEYDRIRKELEQGVDGSEEAEERRRALEDGVFFVEESKTEVFNNGSTK